MTDTSNTVHPQLAAHAQAYFAALPQLPTTPAPTITAGVYVENASETFTQYGVSRRTAYMLRVARADGSRTGTTVSFNGVSLAAADTTTTGFLALEERGDAAKGDDVTTLERLLQPYGAEGQGWARAIANAPDRAARFERAISAMQGVPPNAPTPADEVVMVAYLVRHFTYDETGAYYTKWQNPAATSRRFPDDLHADYKQKAVIEYQLDRDNFYCYSVVTAAPTGDVHPATESVVRIRLHPDGTTATLETIYSASRREAQPRNDHCFFYAHAGRNIAVPESARGSLSPELASLRLHRPLSEVLAELRASDDAAVLDATNTKLKVTGIVRPGATLSALPQGVELISEAPGDAAPPASPDQSGDAHDTFADGLQDHVRVFLCPPDKLVELAANPDVLVLHRVTRAALANTQIRTTVDYAGFVADVGATPVGTDVFIGVVDSGIKGNHPAFAGRIHKVWDQNAATNAAYPAPSGTGNNFGQVWSDPADISAKATDELGHGTHVAGTAAAAVGTGFTEAGMAPAAKLLIVKTDFDSDHIRRGVEWCFREAGTKPCVVNLSLGNAFHGCDGVDDFSLAVRGTFRKRNRGSTGYHWLPGRVVCVAAGNAGDCRGHTHVASLANGATASFPVIVAARTTATGAAIPHPATRITLLARPLPATARGARVDVRVRRTTAAGPAATKWFTFVATGAPDTDVIGTTVVSVVNGPPPPGDSMGLVYTQHQQVEITLFDNSPAGIPSGTWTVEIVSRTAVDIQVDGYVLPGVQQRQTHRVFFQNATKQSLMGSPSTAYGVVAVGSMVNRATWTSSTTVNGTTTQPSLTDTYDPATNLSTSQAQSVVGQISSFTNPGPVRGTTRTIVAMLPGEGVLSAMATDASGNPASLFRPADVVDANTGQMSGTSMACPVATGLVAGMLGKHPTLTANQVIARFQRSVRTPAPTDWDATRFGPGLLDASKLLD